MKKFFILSFFAFIALFVSNLEAVAAKGKAPLATYEPTVYDGVELDYCVTNYKAFEYALLAGQTLDAGSVIISTDGDYVTITINGLSLIDDVHVYLYGENDPLPTKRPTPGQAPYVLEDVNDTTAELMIPLNGETSITLAIHVAFTDDVDNDMYGIAGETAYAGDDDSVFDGKGAWFYLVGFDVIACETTEPADVLYIAAHAALTNQETAWALGQYTFIDENISNKWGWFLSVNSYGTHTFDIYYGAGQNNLTAGTLIGTLEVEYTPEDVTITFVLTEPLLEEIQVYVGYTYPTTSAPGQYDYKVEDLGGVYEQGVTVNLDDLE